MSNRNAPAAAPLSNGMILWLVTLLLGLIGAFFTAITTFPTVKYVDEKHQEAIQHSDMNRAAMEDKVSNLKMSVERTESMVTKLFEDRFGRSRR